jgi:hypothetical protein
VVNATRVEIDRCNVANFASDGIYINAPGVEVRVANSSSRANNYAGIRLVDGNLTVERSHLDDNGHAGVVAVHAARATIDQSSLSGNGAFGVKADAFSSGGARITVARSLVAQNDGYGLAATAASGGTATLFARWNTITDSGIACNTCAGVLSDAAAGSFATVFASGNVVTGSAGYGFKQAQSGALVSAHDNAVIANDTAATAGTITATTGE